MLSNCEKIERVTGGRYQITPDTRKQGSQQTPEQGHAAATGKNKVTGKETLKVSLEKVSPKPGVAKTPVNQSKLSYASVAASTPLRTKQLVPARPKLVKKIGTKAGSRKQPKAGVKPTVQRAKGPTVMFNRNPIPVPMVPIKALKTVGRPFSVTPEADSNTRGVTGVKTIPKKALPTPAKVADKTLIPIATSRYGPAEGDSSKRRNRLRSNGRKELEAPEDHVSNWSKNLDAR
ncbi:unnamed protein product [Echinostoma caproni]|uniref:H15 domain-containing protein n=1 Tax=Echinostoma caproni TaxID=27848 RepID=A0A183B7J1_9TREM|nr:unnamed protein product [Echinostoma caproni]